MFVFVFVDLKFSKFEVNVVLAIVENNNIDIDDNKQRFVDMLVDFDYTILKKSVNIKNEHQ